MFFDDAFGGARSVFDPHGRLLAVNLAGAFFESQAVLPHMIQRGSIPIVNVSSLVGETRTSDRTSAITINPLASTRVASLLATACRD